jgi:hypothetical protein
MPWRRFDGARLHAIAPEAVTARCCARSDALVAACRAAAETQPLAVLHGDDPEIARRACLQLDGSWCMVDASAVGRLTIRLRALLTDTVWDAGWASDPGALPGFEPRRATLIVVQGEPGAEVLADLARRAPGWRRPLCLLVLPGLQATAARPSICVASASAASMPSTPADMMPPA